MKISFDDAWKFSVVLATAVGAFWIFIDRTVVRPMELQIASLERNLSNSSDKLEENVSKRVESLETNFRDQIISNNGFVNILSKSVGRLEVSTEAVSEDIDDLKIADAKLFENQNRMIAYLETIEVNVRKSGYRVLNDDFINDHLFDDIQPKNWNVSIDKSNEDGIGRISVAPFLEKVESNFTVAGECLEVDYSKYKVVKVRKESLINLLGKGVAKKGSYVCIEGTAYRRRDIVIETKLSPTVACPSASIIGGSGYEVGAGLAASSCN